MSWGQFHLRKMNFDFFSGLNILKEKCVFKDKKKLKKLFYKSYEINKNVRVHMIQETNECFSENNIYKHFQVRKIFGFYCKLGPTRNSALKVDRRKA